MKSTKEGRLAKETGQILAGNRGVGQWRVTRAKGRSGYQEVVCVQLGQ